MSHSKHIIRKSVIVGLSFAVGVVSTVFAAATYDANIQNRANTLFTTIKSNASKMDPSTVPSYYTLVRTNIASLIQVLTTLDTSIAGELGVSNTGSNTTTGGLSNTGNQNTGSTTNNSTNTNTSTNTTSSAPSWKETTSGTKVCTSVGGGMYANEKLAASYKCIPGEKVSTQTNCTAADVTAKAPQSYANYECVGGITAGGGTSTTTNTNTKWIQESAISRPCATIGGGTYGDNKLAPSYKCKLGEALFTQTNCTAADVAEGSPQSITNYRCVADTSTPGISLNSASNTQSPPQVRCANNETLELGGKCIPCTTSEYSINGTSCLNPDIAVTNMWLDRNSAKVGDRMKIDYTMANSKSCEMAIEKTAPSGSITFTRWKLTDHTNLANTRYDVRAEDITTYYQDKGKYYIVFRLECDNAIIKRTVLPIEGFDPKSTGSTNTTTIVVTDPNAGNTKAIPVNYITSNAPADSIKSGQYVGIYHIDMSIDNGVTKMSENECKAKPQWQIDADTGWTGGYGLAPCTKGSQITAYDWQEGYGCVRRTLKCDDDQHIMNNAPKIVAAYKKIYGKEPSSIEMNRYLLKIYQGADVESEIVRVDKEINQRISDIKDKGNGLVTAADCQRMMPDLQGGAWVLAWDKKSCVKEKDKGQLLQNTYKTNAVGDFNIGAMRDRFGRMVFTIYNPDGVKMQQISTDSLELMDQLKYYNISPDKLKGLVTTMAGNGVADSDFLMMKAFLESNEITSSQYAANTSSDATDRSSAQQLAQKRILSVKYGYADPSILNEPIIVYEKQIGGNFIQIGYVYPASGKLDVIPGNPKQAGFDNKNLPAVDKKFIDELVSQNTTSGKKLVQDLFLQTPGSQKLAPNGLTDADVYYWQSIIEKHGISYAKVIIKDALKGDDRREQIRDLYQTIFNREPDMNGLEYWVNSKLTIDEIRANFQQIKSSNSDKGANTTVNVSSSNNNSQATDTARELRKNQITELYRTILKKEPDQAGLTYWINDSMSIDQIRATFINVQAEEDAKNQVKNTSTQSTNIARELRKNQITELYRTILKREPDEAGLTYWINDSMTIEQIRANFVTVKSDEDAKNQVSTNDTESQHAPALPEFVGPKLPTVTPVIVTPTISPRRQQIMGLYEAVLGRPADLPGLDYWDASGESIDQIKVHFWASQEFQDKNK